MNQLLKIILRGESLLDGRSHFLKKTLPFCSCNYTKIACPGQIVSLNIILNGQYVQSTDHRRTYTNNRDGKEPQVQSLMFPRTLKNGKIRRKRFRDSIEERQKRFQKGMEYALEERKVALTNARRKIQERGKLIMQDIKETKEKMREKIEEVIERENVYTIPNLLCVTRIGLSPFLGYLIVSQQFGYALVFMAIAGISDWIDGWIARNYKSQSSKLGSFLDPMADKVLIGTLFLTLTYVELIPLALTTLIIGRDVILIISGFVIRYRSLPAPRTLSRYFDVTHATAQLAPTFISKINTGIQLVLVGATLGAPILGYVNHSYLQVLWYVTASSTVAAACSYIFSKETYRYLKTQEKK